jgi:hypothetical protein
MSAVLMAFSLCRRDLMYISILASTERNVVVQRE